MAIIGYGLSGLGRVVLIVSRSWIGVFVWKLIDRTGKVLFLELFLIDSDEEEY